MPTLQSSLGKCLSQNNGVHHASNISHSRRPTALGKRSHVSHIATWPTISSSSIKQKRALSQNVMCTPILWGLKNEGGIAENPKSLLMVNPQRFGMMSPKSGRIAGNCNEIRYF